MAEAIYRIYIDAHTGNWGDADGIVFVNITAEEQDDLAEMSDTQIKAFAATTRKAGWPLDGN